jgi:redox-sensitive bicupin YhaK (pirin superfamily)
MTAGKGIVHAEMPASGKGVTCTGLQLWINLPAKAKMMDPRYQELKDAEVPRAFSEDKKVEVKVIAGESLGVKAKVHTNSPIYYLDFKMQPGAKFSQVRVKQWMSCSFLIVMVGFTYVDFFFFVVM